MPGHARVPHCLEPLEYSAEIAPPPLLLYPAVFGRSKVLFALHVADSNEEMSNFVEIHANCNM
jgi:hypothetical protein